MEKILVENLDLFYGNFQALKNVSLPIQANEITAFIGPVLSSTLVNKKLL